MRRIIEIIKKPFSKEVITEERVFVEFVPTRRDINYIKLMPTTEEAQTLYDYIYNKYVSAIIWYEKDKAEIYKDLMIEIKQLAEKQWHKIKL